LAFSDIALRNSVSLQHLISFSEMVESGSHKRYAQLGDALCMQFAIIRSGNILWLRNA
jgi:hypothetical protein